jgi:RNA recognition motif-containing protein
VRINILFYKILSILLIFSFLFFIIIISCFQIVVIHNSINGKPRGYAFIEYEHERDMHCKYKYNLQSFFL